MENSNNWVNSDISGTQLYSGNASDAGIYNLTDNIKNYTYIEVYWRV